VKFQYDESVAAHDRIERIIQDLHVEREAHPELKALVEPLPDAGAAVGIQAADRPDGHGSGSPVETLIPSGAPPEERPDAKKDDPAQ
jgi:hypothetical protein